MNQFTNDLQLAKAVAAGDREAVDTLVERIGPPLRILARYRAGEQDYEDYVQETLIVVLEKIRSYQGQSSLAGWACGILRNLVRHSVWRKGRLVGKEVSSDAEWWRDVPGDAKTVDEGAEATERQIAIDDIVRGMPSEWREVWTLACQGLSQSEIAVRLSTAESNVQGWVGLARKHIVREMSKVDLAVVEEGLEAGIEWASKGKMRIAWDRFMASVYGLANRVDSEQVWRLRTQLWARLGWIAMSMPEHPSDDTVMRMRAARKMWLEMFGDVEEAAKAGVIELTLHNRRRELSNSRQVWGKLDELRKSNALGRAGRAKVAEVDVLLGTIEGRMGERPIEEAIKMTRRGIDELRRLEVSDDYGIGLVRLAELLIIQGDLNGANKLLEDAETAIPEGFTTAKSLMWYTWHLASVVDGHDDGWQAESARMVKRYAGSWDIGDYISGVRERCRIVEGCGGARLGSDHVRRLVRPERLTNNTDGV